MNVDSAEVVLQVQAILGEGLVWDAARQQLLWVDIEARLVHRYDPATHENQQTLMPGRVGFAAPRSSGGLILALEQSFSVLDVGATAPRQIARVDADLPTRMNDGNCDARGRLFAGTMALDECSPIGALYRLDPDGALERIIDRVAVSNGVDWSVAGDTMYYIDSAASSLDALDFDVASGRVSNRRPLVRFAATDGVPDGLTVDAEGCLWVALWGGWSVRRYTPAGELDRIVELPVAQITTCAFGGADLDELYVASARDGLSAVELAEQSDAGSLFLLRPGILGRHQHPFGG